MIVGERGIWHRRPGKLGEHVMGGEGKAGEVEAVLREGRAADQYCPDLPTN